MPIRIGVEVDSGNKLGKLSQDLKEIGTSLEKTGVSSKKAAAGIAAAGASVSGFIKQSQDAQKSAQNLYKSWILLSKLKPTEGIRFKGITQVFEAARRDVDKYTISLKKAREEYYKFATVKTSSGNLVQRKEHVAVTNAGAEEQANNLLMQSEKKLQAALGQTVAYKEKDYLISIKRAEAAQIEAAAVERLALAGKAVTGPQGRANIAAELKKEETAVSAATAAYNKKGQAALKAGKYAAQSAKAAARAAQMEAKKISAVQRMSMAASGSTIAPSAMQAMKAEAFAKTNVQLTKHNELVEKGTKGYKKMNAAMRGAAGGFGKLWMSYGGNMVGMIAGFAAASAAADAFRQSVDFEYITKYTAALEDSNGALEKVQQNILNLRGVASSPVELAEGFREMVKAGKEVGEVINNDVLKTMSRFSTVSGQDLAGAIQLAVTQVNAFGEVTKRSTGDILSYSAAADQMTKAVHSAPITFSDLTQSLAHTTELATTVGASFDEITTALALMGQAGIKSSKAGTSLRTGLTKLMSPTGMVAKQFKALGINLKEAFDADGTMNVKKALMMYKKAYETLDPLSKVRFMKEGLGLRSQKAIAALMRELDNWDERNKEIRESAGEIDRVYEELRETVKVSSAEFANAFTSEAIKEILPLLPAIAKAFKFATAHVEELVAMIKTAVQVTGLLVIIWTGGKMIKAIQAATKAVLAYNVAVAAGGALKGGGGAAALYGAAGAGASKAAGTLGKSILARMAVIGTAAGATLGSTLIAAATAGIVGWNIGRVLKDKLDIPDAGKILESLTVAPGSGKIEEMEYLLADIEFYKAKIEKLKVEPNLNYDRIEEFREKMGLASIEYDLLKSQVEKESLFDKANAKMIKTLDDFKMDKIEVDLSINAKGVQGIKVDMVDINAMIASNERDQKDWNKALEDSAATFKKMGETLDYLKLTKGMSEAERAQFDINIAAKEFVELNNLSTQAMLEYIAQARQIANLQEVNAATIQKTTDSLKDYKETLKSIKDFKVDTGKKLEGFEDQEVEIEFKLKAADTSEADALLLKYNKLFAASRGGKVAGSDAQLSALAKQYHSIDTERERMQKLQVARAKEFEALAGLAAEKGVDGYKEQVHWLEKARAIYEGLDTSVDKVTKKQVAQAKQQWEYQQKITGGGKRAWGTAAKAYNEAYTNYKRLAKAEKEGTADPKKKSDAMKAQLTLLQQNTAAEKAAATEHLNALDAQAVKQKQVAEEYGNTPTAISKATAEAALTVNQFHTAWIEDIARVQEGYGKIQVTGDGQFGKAAPEVQAGAKTDFSAEQKQLDLGKQAVAEEGKLKEAKLATQKVAKGASTDLHSSVQAAKDQVAISKEAAAAVVADHENISGAVAGASELIVKIGDEWTNVDSKIIAAGVSVEDNKTAVEESTKVIVVNNGKVVISVDGITASYEAATRAAKELAAAAASVPAASGASGARAAGGPVSAGKSYWVGEKGVELFSPTKSGYIVPNNKLTANGDTVNINLSVNNEPPVMVQGTHQSARDIAAMFNRQKRLSSK